MTNVIQLQQLTKTELFDQLEGLIDRKLSTLLESNPNEKLSIQSVSEELGVSKLTVHNYIKKGFIPASKIGRRVVIKRVDLEKSLAEVKSLKYRR
ncbi:helix-turn-helix domain-containing protein [Mangrovimonas xylaniphaga]|uniref:helix-turn-helix domain-containing protein n=1 Tax=Mangrovimonas xylaniphaga TaxID=1645915 RepID=UPI0006B6751F|nr:helix-turn-helix domain-containing protein [Mangrovimonas xylaniphaga]